MTVATARYGYQTAPWDAPLAWGTHAFIEYNGCVLNDRHQSDRIRVTRITGLDEADSTDNREGIPGDDGEIVYDGAYRGRTIIMSGRIEAGSLGMLKKLERDLRAACAPLTESPMKFRWFDVVDTFDTPTAGQSTLYNYTPQYGNPAPLSCSGGVLRWSTTTDTMLLRTADNRMWGDAQTTIRIVVGSVDSSSVYLVPKFLNPSNFVKVSVGTSLTISTIIAGSNHQLSSIVLPAFTQGQSIWLRAKVEGDLVTAEVWTSPPTENQLPSYSTTAWLNGSDADQFGDGVLSQIGFGASTATPNWTLDDFRIESISPCDVILNVKKPPNGLSIPDSQDSATRFNRTFQLSLRASWPYALCATQSRSATLVPSAAQTPVTGFRFPLRFPLRFSNYSPGAIAPQANNLLFVNNRGTAPARVKILVYGAVTGGFTLVNLTNSQQINWNGNLADGDYLLFNTHPAAKTLVNSAGVNQMRYFSSTSPEWMTLEPGWNDLYFGGSGYSGNTKVVVFYRGSWI